MYSGLPRTTPTCVNLASTLAGPTFDAEVEQLWLNTPQGVGRKENVVRFDVTMNDGSIVSQSQPVR
jgi:hypothetical protein